MSAKIKGTASGRPETAMERFKAAWKKLSEPSQAYWREQLSSQRTQADLRREIKAKLKVELPADNYLTRFRSWLDAEDQRGVMAEKIEQRKKELLAGGMTLEEAQEVLLVEAAAYSTAARDFKLGLKTSREITTMKAGALDRQKFEFDAARACLAKLPELKAVSDKPKLSDEEKAKAIQQILFPQ